MNTPFVGKKDFLIILALIIIALGVWGLSALYNTGKAAYGEIYHENTLLATVDLSVNQVFSLPECPHVEFEVYEGTVAFVRSDCPDQTCVRTGRLSKNGAFAACLPNKLSLRVSGADGDVDVVLR